MIHSAGAAVGGEICKRIFIGGEELTAFPIKLVVKAVRDGKLAGDLQAEMQRRHLFSDGKVLMSYLAGLFSDATIRELIQLNSLPSEVSGIPAPIVLDPQTQNPENWFEDTKLTKDDIVEAYNYTVITEQLKRLDALLRNTQVVAKALGEAVGSVNYDLASWINLTGLPTDRVAVLKGLFPNIEKGHPLHEAVMTENARITELLLKLRSGDPELISRARRGLLDTFRNAITDLIDSTGGTATVAERGMIDKTLRLIKTTVLERFNHDATFTILLTYVEKLWTVSWAIGSTVFINTVKSRVTTSSTQASQKLSGVLKGFNMF
jgi:hypothetical protein